MRDPTGSNVLTSPKLAALGIRHGFNLRYGGASVGPFESFNLGRSVGDEPEAVAHNHALFAESLGIANGALFTASQVHGATARYVERSEDPSDVRSAEADVLIAREPGVAVGVSVADCVPVLLIDRATGAAAAVHAGWRGVVAEAVGVGVHALIGADASSDRARSVHAAIFPHIRVCCFEVGEDVAEPLAAAGAGALAIDRSRAKPHVNLAMIVRAQLEQLGLAPLRIDDVPGCTRCEADRFFSFRRDGKRSGRHIAAIVSGEAAHGATSPR